jgi:hypothetical protein
MKIIAMRSQRSNKEIVSLYLNGDKIFGKLLPMISTCSEDVLQELLNGELTKPLPNIPPQQQSICNLLVARMKQMAEITALYRDEELEKRYKFESTSRNKHPGRERQVF